MSLADLVAAQTQSPSIRCWLASGANYATLTEITPAPISAVYSRAFDQAAATCTLEFSQNLYFQPGTAEQIHVYEGYGSDIRRTFTGFIDDMAVEEHPYKRVMVMRDVMKLAIETWLDDEGVSYINAQAETAVGDLLNRAGLTSLNLGTTNFTIGDINPAKFKLMSIMDAVQQICNLIGWQVWADKNGVVQFQYRKPKPGSVIAWTYERASDGVSSNVLKYKFTATDRDLRNRIVVIGYTDKLGNTIRSEAAAASQYVADPPKYRTAIESSELIDTQSMADWIAGWMLNDLNDLRLVTDLTAVGNPLLDVGATVRLYDPDAAFDQKAFVFSIRSTNDGASGRYEYEMVCIGGVSDSGNYIPPPNHTCPPGYTWNDAGQVCVPNPNLLPPPGDGSRAYVGTSKGVARGDTLLTAPTWTAVNTGLNTANSKKIRNLLFDPWSSDGTQLTGMYALTDDGVFKGAGLPNPTWTQVLTNAQMLSLVGGSTLSAYESVSPADVCLTSNLLLPITTQNYVAIVLARYNVSWPSNSRTRLFMVYSTDGGTTWNCNQNNWIATTGKNNGYNYRCSLTQSGVFYALVDENNDSGTDQDHPSGFGGSYKPNFFQLDSAGHAAAKSAFFSTDDGYDLKFDILYADAAGNVIGNDNNIRWTNQHGHAYTGITSSKGFNEISNPFSPAYGSGYITETNRSGAGMNFGWLIDWCTWSPNDIYLTDSNGVGVNTGTIWDSHDGGLTWHVTNLAPAFSPAGMAIRGISALPGNKNLCMAANGVDITHPTGLVGLTVNGGSIWTDISANLQAVLGLSGAGDEATIIKPDWIWVTPGLGG